MTYEELRERVIEEYRYVYKDEIAMDICEVSKEDRVRMMEDEYYKRKVKVIRGELFKEEMGIIDNVIAGVYENSEKPSDRSGIVLRALEMKQDLVLGDINKGGNEGNELNVSFISQSLPVANLCDSIEINEGGNNEELGEGFGEEGGGDSFAERMKAEVEERLKGKQ